MATSQSQSFKGGSISPGPSIVADDLKNLVVNRKTDGGVQQQKIYAPLIGETFNVGRAHIKVNGTEIGSYDPLDADKDIDIDLDGYWHDGPTTTGSGNVVTSITLGNDGVPQVEKGMSAEPAFSVLPISKGGTGKTTGKAATNNLFSDINSVNTEPDDTARIVFKYGSPSDSTGIFFARSITSLWDYIKGKISSVLGLSENGYTGNAATATTATTATNYTSGGSIDNALAGKSNTSHNHDERYVRFDTNSQGLTDTQKSNARTNIGAGTSNLTLGIGTYDAARGNHAHGLLANDGSFGSQNWAVSNLDRIVIAKNNYNGKEGYLVPSALHFDGDEDGKALTQSAEWKPFLPPTGDGSGVSVTPDGTSTGTDIGYITTLNEWAQKFKNLVSSLKALAFKAKVSDSDISGTISDSHISSADTWNGKQNALGISSLGNADKYINQKGEWRTPTNTWKLNDFSNEGYVKKGEGNYDCVWATNSNGAPDWHEISGLSVGHANNATSASNYSSGGGIDNALKDKAPKLHIDTQGIYGLAKEGYYGHVKLAKGNISGRAYSDGEAASVGHNHDGSYLKDPQSHTLQWGGTSVIGTYSGNNITLTMPANPFNPNGDYSSNTLRANTAVSADSAQYAVGASNYTQTGNIATFFGNLTNHSSLGFTQWKLSSPVVNYVPSQNKKYIDGWDRGSDTNKRRTGVAFLYIQNNTNSTICFDLKVTLTPAFGTAITYTFTLGCLGSCGVPFTYYMDLVHYKYDFSIYKNPSVSTGSVTCYVGGLVYTGIFESTDG